jgi:ATP-dependent DNA ligase
VGRANERNGAQQAEFEAQALWTKKKRLKYYETVEEAQGQLDIRPMLAQKYKDRVNELQFPVMVQPKLNGLRCTTVDGPRLLSRGRKFYEMAHIIDELPKDLNLHLDGELYIHGQDLQTINSLVRDPREESFDVELHVYDCFLDEGEVWEYRYMRLTNFFLTFSEFTYIQMVNTVIANNDHEVQALHDSFVADGYEGAIIRTMDHPYRFGYRSPGLLKLKAFEDKEFPIFSWAVSDKGVFMWVVQQEEGKLFEVVPKGTVAQKAVILRTANQQIGRSLTVRFIGRTEDNIPVHAVGIGVRDVADM